ncbi:P-loop containing nucleoside triphosphate hydrolase protein [Piptocephalis cylindrospora]|uniref:P-loop containing nucleoside triphosphate hydrolase protein n=1 Tax=Piptocephalis cylindrospora TaxID=1907219 RepID=A0A4P9Y722_9FUNG|nr:P-loop containing nucleoside triphosphate hydrolase protein [Piptocephalis cylindrospora]|eukprot:RKP14622.1 P-loop containing nucleoside triphosphate hydrolase protein [Piptocephalis cylindrospora]
MDASSIKTASSVDPNEKKVSFFQLYRFATPYDRLLIAFASFCAAANGTSQPLMTLLFAGIIDVFTKLGANGAGDASSKEKFQDDIVYYVIWFVILAAATFVVSYFQMSIWMYVGERQCKKMRELYYASVLRQEIGWFDRTSSGNLTSRLSGDINLIQDGISEKVGLIIQYAAMFIAGFAIAFSKGWKMSLVMLSVMPLLIAAGGFMAKMIAGGATSGQDAYGKSGAIAEEVLSAIKTVSAFGGQSREMARYKVEVDKAMVTGLRKSYINGAGVGTIMFIMFCTYALGFWYGSKLSLDGEMTAGGVVNVFLALIIGAMSLGQAAPNIAAISSAIGAAGKIFSVIDRVPLIDSALVTGEKPDRVDGSLEFRNVRFHYPTRPDVPILEDYSLSINPGETVALVGSSGSGKSTLVALTERFYDPVEGAVFLDGRDLKDLNIQWLRRHVGLVGQEPVLFGASIYQNIAWGSASESQVPTREEVEEAAKSANAHDFISALPNGYDTLVGAKGALLSGGQKQRIAIARAIIKNPKVLLLDEATSALDTESERIVQSALDRASQGRTTIVVAHRLSTIREADKIVVMSKGKIIEAGKHDELLAQGGLYSTLVQAQALKKEVDSGNDIIPEEESTGEMTEMPSPSGKEGAGVKRALSRAEFTEAAKTLAQEKDIESAKGRSFPYARLFRLNRPEKWYLVGGLVGAIVDGCIFPTYALIFTQVLTVFQHLGDEAKFKRESTLWSCMFLVLAVVSLFSLFGKIGMFGVSGEKLAARMRLLTFGALLRQEMGFFDLEENGSGALGSKLATESDQVKNITGMLVGNIIQIITTLIYALILAFIHGWKLSLVVFACVPLVGLAGYLQMAALTGFGEKTKKAYEESAQIACETVENMRTVSSLSREESFKVIYNHDILLPHRIAVRGAFLSSLGFSCSQAINFLVFALAFWYGSTLILSGEMTVEDMFQVMFAVIFSAMAIGQVASFTPSLAKGKISAIAFFDLLDRKTLIDPNAQGGQVAKEFTGLVQGKDVCFTYPARPEVPILRGLDVTVMAGKTVAIVGGSGSGKSTLVALVQRFYDADSGLVSVDGLGVQEWNLEALRANIAAVGQEPILFDLSIRENIAYGKVGGVATEEEVIEAAKGANIHSFVSNLPDGYDTRVGERGGQLSGGQKQRVAIARALIRNPKLLLLDEATSALDSESEKIVQDALDRASMDRTTITIAHRLSTIQNADLIVVVKDGQVQEQGKHQELLALRGLYYKLVQQQSLERKAV